MMWQKMSFVVGPKTPKDIRIMAKNRGINLIERPSVNEFRDYDVVHLFSYIYSLI